MPRRSEVLKVDPTAPRRAYYLKINRENTALKKANKKLVRANEDEMFDVVMNAILFCTHESLTEVRKLMVMLFLHFHFNANKYSLHRRFPFLKNDHRVINVLKSLENEGKLIYVPGSLYKVYTLTRVGRDYIRAKIEEFRNFRV